MYVAFGTNRYWCLEQLGWKDMPAIISLNKGVEPPWPDSVEVKPQEFKQYAPPGQVWVTDHSFGWQLETPPEDEFCQTVATT